MENNFTAICPLDGRYKKATAAISATMSEQALMHQRLVVEIAWLEHLSAHNAIACPKINSATKKIFAELKIHLSANNMMKIKQHEQSTLHDVKAVEYFIRDIVTETQNADLCPWIHFACTSEDINNTAYALMLKQLQTKVIVPNMLECLKILCTIATNEKSTTMLGWTHGQAASPTTMGKELAMFLHRLTPLAVKIANHNFSAKFNGAVGNHNAHKAAYPELHWPKICSEMIASLGLEYNTASTQISNHDNLIEFISTHKQFMTILQDLSQDIWLYIHKNYLRLRKENPSQVGSSTMPHKINPIDFENAEGNIGMHKAICNFMMDKLPISRMQRDLSDSTTLRNLGVCFGYAQIAISSINKGLNKISSNQEQIKTDLNKHWEVIGEGLQTIMRKYGIENAYEVIKEYSQGNIINEQSIKDICCRFKDNADVYNELVRLTPENYSGYAEAQTQEIVDLTLAILQELILDQQ